MVRKQITLTELIERSKKDPVFFAEAILGIRLHEAQKTIIRCKDRYISACCARRFGKSYVFSALSTWLACCNENYSVICVSRSQRQSSVMFRTIKSMIMKSLVADSITRSTLTRIEFSNGSSIESLPGSSYDGLRGIGCHCALVDEAAFCDEELFTVIHPMILTTKGRLILISTPNTSAGEFYRSCQPESEYTKFHFTHNDVRFSDGSTLVDADDLEKMMWRLGGPDSPRYKRELEGRFTDAEGAFFDLAALDDCLKPDMCQLKFGIPGHKYAIGADLAQKEDFTVISVLDFTNKNDLQIVNTVRFNGKSTDEILRELYKEVRAFDSKNILIDEAGIGRSLIEHLKLLYPHIRWGSFNFNTTSKIMLLNDLNVALCTRILAIPDDDIIREELVSFCYEENPNTHHLKLGGRGTHDDTVISLALSLKAANVFTKKGDFIIGTNKGILTLQKNAKNPPRYSKVIHY